MRKLKGLLIGILILSFLVIGFPTRAVDVEECDYGYFWDLQTEMCKQIPQGNILFTKRPKITNFNYWTNVNGSMVTVNWLTNQFMTGEVLVKGADFKQVFTNSTESLATYHTVDFHLDPGFYQITRRSVYQGVVFESPAQTLLVR